MPPRRRARFTQKKSRKTYKDTPCVVCIKNPCAWMSSGVGRSMAQIDRCKGCYNDQQLVLSILNRRIKPNTKGVRNENASKLRFEEAVVEESDYGQTEEESEEETVKSDKREKTSRRGSASPSRSSSKGSSKDDNSSERSKRSRRDYRKVSVKGTGLVCDRCHVNPPCMTTYRGKPKLSKRCKPCLDLLNDRVKAYQRKKKMQDQRENPTSSHHHSSNSSSPSKSPESTKSTSTGGEKRRDSTGSDHGKDYNRDDNGGEKSYIKDSEELCITCHVNTRALINWRGKPRVSRECRECLDYRRVQYRKKQNRLAGMDDSYSEEQERKINNREDRTDHKPEKRVAKKSSQKDDVKEKKGNGGDSVINAESLTKEEDEESHPTKICFKCRMRTVVMIHFQSSSRWSTKCRPCLDLQKLSDSKYLDKKRKLKNGQPAYIRKKRKPRKRAKKDDEDDDEWRM